MALTYASAPRWPNDSVEPCVSPSHLSIGNPFRTNELGGVATILQVLANGVCFVILSAEDAFREILDEVEVFSPYRENVLLADLSTYLVGIVVAHEAKVRIY